MAISHVNRILLGDFVGCENENPDEGFPLEPILNHYASLSNKPVIKGIPAGHDKDNEFISFGVYAVMIAQNDGTASLFIDGSTLRE